MCATTLRLKATAVVVYVVFSSTPQSVSADAKPDSLGNDDFGLLEDGAVSCLSLLQVGARLAGGAQRAGYAPEGRQGGRSAELPKQDKLLEQVQTEIEQALASLSADSGATPRLQISESGLLVPTATELAHPKSVANVYDESATKVKEHTVDTADDISMPQTAHWKSVATVYDESATRVKEPAVDKADDILMRVAAEDLSQLKKIMGSGGEHGTAQVRQQPTLAEDISSVRRQSIPVITTGNSSENSAEQKTTNQSNSLNSSGNSSEATTRKPISSVGLGSWMFVLVCTGICMGYICFTCISEGGFEAMEEGAEEAYDAMGDIGEEISFCCSTITGACFNHSSATVVVVNITFLWVVCITLYLMWKYQIIQPIADEMLCYVMIMIILVYVMFLVFVSILNELNGFKDKFNIEAIKEEMEEAARAMKELEEKMLADIPGPNNCCGKK